MADRFLPDRIIPCVIVFLMAVAALSAMGCMVNIPDSPAPTIGPDAYSARSPTGVKLWVDPYAKKERVIGYFGYDLLEYGVIPVFVRVQNGSNATILLEARAFSMYTYQGGTHPAAGGARVHSARLEAKKDLVGGMIFLTGSEAEVSIIDVINPFLGLVVKQQQRNTNAILINMRKMALKEQTIFANGSASGFVYLALSGVRSVSNAPTLAMEILSTRGDVQGRIEVGMPISPQDLARPEGQHAPIPE